MPDTRQDKGPHRQLHWPAPSRRAWLELVIVVAALIAYFGVRAVTQ